MTTKEINNAIEISADFLQACYLDYLNNFINAESYDNFYELPLKDAIQHITIGMKIHSIRTSG